MLLAGKEDVAAGWLRSLRRGALAPGLSVDLWFECRTAGEPWTHVCRVRDGQVVDWRPENATRACIVHDPAAMDDLVAGRIGVIDPRWALAARPGAEARPLPPLDLDGVVVDLGGTVVPHDLDLTWTTVCTVAEDVELAYASHLRGGHLSHRLLPADSPRSGALLTLRLIDHLRWRAGGDLMGAFDHGAVVGDLDELIFLAGFLELAPVRDALRLADPVAWRANDHIALFGALTGGDQP